MVAISMPFQEAGIISATAIPLGISDLTLGIIVALIFGCVLFIVKYGKQCCDNIKWIIDIYKMNKSKETGGKEPVPAVEPPDEELSKEEIKEIKEEISTLTKQIKTTLAEIKKIRKTEALNALETDIRLASTQYAMKFELKRPEYDQAMRILQVTITKMPEEAVEYNQKIIKWIAKAQKKFIKYSPENFGQKVEALNAKRRREQNK
jgi:MFS superfamily sulfate permease-like transporter